MRMFLTLLASHTPLDEKETNDLTLMRELAASLERPFARDQWPAHFTGSAVVADPSGTRVVMLHHAKLNRWLQPGGHAETADGGDLRLTATREAREETGLEVELLSSAPLDVDVHTIPARSSEPSHRHLDVRFLFIAKNPEALTYNPNESFGAQWLTFSDAFERADEAPLKRLLTKAHHRLQELGAKRQLNAKDGVARP